MALVRYLFLGNATNPDLPVDRYVASGNPLNDRGLSPHELQVMGEHRRAAAAHDMLSPSEWCATNADDLEVASKPVSEGGDPSRYKPSPQVTAFLGRNLSRIDKFIQYCDIELAQDWLAQASRLAAIPYATVEAQSPANQLKHVHTAWTAFGNMFRALNVRPYGWAKYRRAWEWAIDPATNRGAPKLAGINLPPVEKVYVGANDAMGALSAWRRDLALTYNRSNPRYALPTGPNRIASVAIGTEGEVEWGWRQSNNPECLSRLQTTSQGCPCPTGDRFAVWMGNDARLRPLSETIAAVLNADGTTVAMDTGVTWKNSTQRFDAYYDDGTMGRIFATAPLKWYMDLLRSLLDELRSKDLLALIYEIRADILGKNRWTIARSGQQVPEIMVGSDNLVVDRQREEMSDRNRIFSYLAPAVALLTVTVPVVGAAVGLLVGVAGAIANLIPASPISLPRDVLGRPLPTYEVFWITEVATMERRAVAAAAMPPRVAERVAIGQMPAGGRVWINGTDVTDYSDPAHPAARWLDAAQTIREFPMPSEESRITLLRVVTPDGVPRDYPVNGPESSLHAFEGVAHVAYSDFLPAKATVRILQPFASLAVDGMPQPRPPPTNAAGTDYRYEVPSGPGHEVVVTGNLGETWSFPLNIPADHMQWIVLSPASLRSPATRSDAPVDPATLQGVVILGIPPFSVVFVGDAPDGNVESRVVGNASNPLWFTPTPTGSVTVRVLSLDQSLRTATVAVSAARISSVAYNAMTITRAASTGVGRLSISGQVGWKLALALVGTTMPFVAADIDATRQSVSEWPTGRYTLGIDDMHGRIATGTLELTAAGLSIDGAAFLDAHTGWITVNGPAGWVLAIGLVGALIPLHVARMPAEGSVSFPWPVGSWAFGVDDGLGHRAVKTITVAPSPARLTLDARAFLTTSTQQRQTMEGSASNAGWYLVGAVALGAGALFVATLKADGRATQRNPRRR